MEAPKMPKPRRPPWLEVRMCCPIKPWWILSIKLFSRGSSQLKNSQNWLLEHYCAICQNPFVMRRKRWSAPLLDLIETTPLMTVKNDLFRLTKNKFKTSQTLVRKNQIGARWEILCLMRLATQILLPLMEDYQGEVGNWELRSLTQRWRTPGF